jgi:hypothetical protein
MSKGMIDVDKVIGNVMRGLVVTARVNNVELKKRHRAHFRLWLSLNLLNLAAWVGGWVSERGEWEDE